jgi:acyl carrier protein
MQHLEQVKKILVDVLGLDEGRESLREDSILLGNIPELDSMSVVNVIAALEETYGITIHDDEISAENFATLGSLTRFIEQKLAE